MKKSILILCVVILFCGLNLQAKPVSVNQAQDIAKKILGSQPATKSGSSQIRLIWDGEDVATKASQPAFYVFGRDGGGFVIIAGDDNVTPVLAISESNEFKPEGMPETVKWWMDRMKVYVRTAKIMLPPRMPAYPRAMLRSYVLDLPPSGTSLIPIMVYARWTLPAIERLPAA